MTAALRFHVNDFPKQFLQLDSITRMVLQFTDSVHILEAIQHVKIGELYLYGKMSQVQKERIAWLLPNTVLSFNGYLCAKTVTKDYLLKELDGNRRWPFIQVSSFPKALLQLDSIKNITLNFEDTIYIPDAIKNVKINKLSLQGKISAQEENKIADLLPATDLYFNGRKY